LECNGVSEHKEGALGYNRKYVISNAETIISCHNVKTGCSG